MLNASTIISYPVSLDDYERAHNSPSMYIIFMYILFEGPIDDFICLILLPPFLRKERS